MWKHGEALGLAANTYVSRLPLSMARLAMLSTGMAAVPDASAVVPKCTRSREIQMENLSRISTLFGCNNGSQLVAAPLHFGTVPRKLYLPVVPHKAVAEVSKIGHEKEIGCCEARMSERKH